MTAWEIKIICFRALISIWVGWTAGLWLFRPRSALPPTPPPTLPSA